MQAFCVGADTHRGRRSKNEDAYCVDPEHGLFIVADGMGGEEGGDVASRIAIEVVRKFFRANDGDPAATWPFPLDPGRSETEYKVAIATRLAGRAIRAMREGAFSKMGATLVVVAFERDELVVGHIGDSRVYLSREGHLKQLTRDHSMYNKFKDAGVSVPPIEEFEYSNVLTRALGYEEDEDDSGPDLRRLTPAPGDRYLLCTDGLTGAVSDERIEEVLAEQPDHIAAEYLIEEAYDAGGEDNMTAVIVGIEDEKTEWASDVGATRPPEFEDPPRARADSPP